MTDATPTAYDTLSYPGHPYGDTHPDRLATIASLYGMRPAPVSRCRVLELGCGDGGNLTPIAYQWPGSEFVGIDLSKQTIARGRQYIDELGLANIDLRRHNIMDVTAEFGQFDYIIAHGVYSWVPAFVREKVLAIFKHNLAPQGVAYVSFNSYPGCHFRNLARDMMLYHVRGMDDPRQRIEQGRAVMKFLAESSAKDGVYGLALRHQFNRVQKLPDYVLFHDDLDEVSSPFFLYQVVEDAARHGLQYLSEATFNRGERHEYPDEAAKTLAQIPDFVAREQYLDFIIGCGFHKTLFCHGDVALRRTIEPQCVKDYHVAAGLNAPAEIDPAATGVVEFKTERGDTLSTDHKLSKAALLHLGQSWPRAVAFADLVDHALRRLGPEAEPIRANLDEEVDGLATLLFRAFSVGEIELNLHPPKLVTTISERPQASLLSRKQAARGSLLTNLRHGAVVMEDEIVRNFVTLVDGTRDVDRLVSDLDKQLQGKSGAEVTREGVERNLRLLATLGLLAA
jgi:SAM-dependent methyltransferase